MERGRNATFTVLAGVLLLLVVLAAFLLIMLAPRSHANQAKPQVGELKAAHCPTGSHAPVCYETVVTNMGTGSGQVLCQVEPAVDTTATFGNDQTTYITPDSSPLAANESFRLLIITKPAPGQNSVAGKPTVACGAVG